MISCCMCTAGRRVTELSVCATLYGVGVCVTQCRASCGRSSLMMAHDRYFVDDGRTARVLHSGYCAISWISSVSRATFSTTSSRAG